MFHASRQSVTVLASKQTVYPVQLNYLTPMGYQAAFLPVLIIIFVISAVLNGTRV